MLLYLMLNWHVYLMILDYESLSQKAQAACTYVRIINNAALLPLVSPVLHHYLELLSDPFESPSLPVKVKIHITDKIL